MLHTNDNEVQRNVERPHTEASQAVLLQLLHQHAGGAFFLNTSQVAALIRKSEAAFRLFESRYRSKYRRDFMPVPLMQNAEGRIWSIAQIARWLAQDGSLVNLPANIDKPVERRRGRPRKSAAAKMGELA